MILALALAAAQPQQTPPSAPAVAQPPPGAEPIPLMIAEPVAMAIAAFDRDGDGQVNRAEFAAGVKQGFDAVSKGQSSIGYVSFGDWAERWLGNRDALPSPFEVDQDGDDKITLAELQARFDLFFERFDRDKDGVVKRSELLTVRQMVRSASERPAEGKGRPPRRR